MTGLPVNFAAGSKHAANHACYDVFHYLQPKHGEDVCAKLNPGPEQIWSTVLNMYIGYTNTF